MTTSSDVTSSTDTERLTGRVKWFNNKAGFGFITVTDGTYAETDVFVHHSAINVSNQQYRYLVQGEYVDFNLVTIESDKYKFHAGSVNGVKGGKLMCETRHDLKVAQSNYKKENTDSNVVSPPILRRTQTVRVSSSEATSHTPVTPRTTQRARVRGEGPREDNKDWTVISKKPTVPRKKRVQLTTSE
jgi:cold shock CspA family protein